MHIETYLHVFALSRVLGGCLLEVLFKIAKILQKRLHFEHRQNQRKTAKCRSATSISSQSSSSTVRSTTSSSLRVAMSTSCSAILSAEATYAPFAPSVAMSVTSRDDFFHSAGVLIGGMYGKACSAARRDESDQQLPSAAALKWPYSVGWPEPG